MRILQLISSEGTYGAETVVLHLAKSLNNMGHEGILGVFQNTHRPHTEIADMARRQGLKVEIIPCNGRADRNAVRAIQDCIGANSIDVVHTHGYKSNFYACVAARRYRTPLIATYHIDWPDRGVALRLYHLLDRVVLRRFDKIVAVSDAVATSLRRFGISSNKITTIDNGIDLSPFKAARPTLREELQSQRRELVGLVGRLTPQKGGEYFLQAARKVLADFPNALFVLIGEGPERQALEELARGVGIAKEVLFAGHRTDMPGVYASLDVLVLPSINEGLPMTLIEAMASAKPVVATPVGAVPRLITAEETGLLVNPRDTAGLAAAIRRLLSDSGLRQKLSANGRAWVMEHFSADVMGRKYYEEYCQLTDSLGAAA